jgi:hypothetical protein
MNVGGNPPGNALGLFLLVSAELLNVRCWPLTAAPVGDSRGSFRGVKRTSQFDCAVAANDPVSVLDGAGPGPRTSAVVPFPDIISKN